MLSSLGHALRILRKDPAFAAIAVLSLAIGIGATSAMFSFAGALLLRPLPVMQPADAGPAGRVVQKRCEHRGKELRLFRYAVTG